MYHQAVRQFVKTLENLDRILDKTVRHANARNFDVNNIFGARLFPDMLPFASQVRIACDTAKNAAASLAGKQPPRHEDDEKSFEQLRARVAKCLAYLETFTAADFEKTTAKNIIPVPNPKGKALYAEDYVMSRALPNFHFHVTTAYAILRHGGVELGKSDYLGTLDFVDT